MGTSPEGLSRFCYRCGISHKITVGSNIYLNHAKKEHIFVFQLLTATYVCQQ